ncbi:IclR family transcriptional regulator [Sphingomonas nostoxanthinifaciens]|uniref:IclR family transcriptional regulator n=1 Tax=Sphingomonas nostoxanthinifaciens TaxID=2872652 RepID=UPI001CC216CD|nr:IclR family transcriptional regulator [Sphingomonas nostoxanthinifaciens]UAK25909.1 IclR family transcriptional regulator [Sphingomonas nostoxanthinifaciens]
MTDDADMERLGKVQSLVRAFNILDALTGFDNGATLTDLARETSLPRSTAHRLLTTMNTLRYVDFDASTNHWMIGVQAFALGNAFVQSRDLGRIGRPIMRSLMIDAGETVNIAIADVDDVAFVGQARPANGNGENTAPGRHMPMHSTASGKALLAFWEKAARDCFLASHAFERRTDLTIVEADALDAELAHIRARGFAIDDQENELGVRCVAAPVFDSKGLVRASLSISGSVARLAEPRLMMLGRTLSLAAQRMTNDIGGLLAA